MYLSSIVFILSLCLLNNNNSSIAKKNFNKDVILRDFLYQVYANFIFNKNRLEY